MKIQNGNSPDPDSPKMTEVPDVIGSFGRWHMGVFSVAFLVKFIGPYQALSGVFYLPKIPFWCSDNQSDYENVLTANHSRSTCHVDIGQSNSSHLIPCSQWEYDHTTFTSTLTEKFNLVCDKAWLISLSNSMYMVGFLVACIVLGYLADKIGRRPTVWIGMICLLSADIAVLFAPNYIVYVVCQFALGFGRTGMLNATYIILMEIVGVKHRSVIGVGVAAGFNIGYMAVPGIAYLLRDWFYIHLVNVCIVGVLAAITWLTPESPRWLLLNGKTEAAERMITKAARINRRALDNSALAVEQLSEALQKGKETNEINHRVNVLDLLKTPNMRKNTCFLFYLWFVSSFVYYGLSYNVQRIGGNLFLSFFLFGAAEVPGTLFAILGLHYLGRKITLMISMSVSAAACFGIVPLNQNLLWLRITLATIGKAMIQCSFESVYVYTVEIVPTQLRSVGMTSASVWARIGSIIAPFMKELGEGNNFIVPMCLFGGLAASSTFITFLLPETRDSPLPDTLKQGENMNGAAKSEIKKKNRKENDFNTRL